MSDEDLPVISLDAYRIERGSRYCRHESRVIDPNSRQLTCKNCNALLDPFDALLQIASERDNMVFRREELRRKIKELEVKLADLKRNEANTRERLKRLSTKRMPLEGA